MLLNMYIIRDYFPSKLLSHLVSDRVRRTLEKPAMVYQGHLEPGCVYVLNPESLGTVDTIAPDAAIIFTAPPSIDPRLEQVDYLYPETALNGALMLNELLSIFLRFQRWELELEAQMRSEDPVQALGDHSLEFLRNPTGIFTASFLILCYYEKCRPSNEAMFDADERGTFMERDTIETLLTMDDFIQTWSTHGPCLFWGAGYVNASDCCLYQNIELNGKMVARVSISNWDYPFQDSDYPILDFFCGYITRALDISQTFSANLHPPYFDQLLLALANGQPCNKEQLRQAMLQMCWQEEHEYFCGYIYSQLDDAVGSNANACSRLEDTIPGSCAVQQDDHILLLINLSKAGKSREEILSQIAVHLREYLLKAGFSNTFSGITNLYEYDRQARVALNFGMKKDSTFWLYRFENYVLHYLLEHATQDLSPRSLCHPGLLRLVEIDRQKNRDYAGSLRAYLENNMNVAQTIRQIYIQRATFQYQLQRITEILGANLQDYETRLHLQLSFRLLDLEAKTPQPREPQE